MTEADAVKIIGKRLFGDNTDWYTVEEAIRGSSHLYTTLKLPWRKEGYDT